MITKNNQQFYSKREILENLNNELSLVRSIASKEARKQAGKLRQAITKVAQGNRGLYPSPRLKDILHA